MGLLPTARGPSRRTGALMLMAIAAIGVVYPARAQLASEAAVKAAYLYKFVPFVVWPDGAFVSPQSPIALCVVGDPEFAQVLRETVAGASVDGRQLAIRALEEVLTPAGCHVMYIGVGTPQGRARVLREAHGAPVLTVTDTSTNQGPKGIIDFVMQDRHLRFEIDDKAAAENGLVISSKLLSLAVTVRLRG